MKRVLFGIIAMVLLASCDKSEAPEQVKEKLYPIEFKVSSFDQEIGDIKSTGTLGSAGITGLDYIVYHNSTGNHYKNTKYDSSMENFGTISDELPEGEYKIVIIGHNQGSSDLTGIGSNEFSYNFASWNCESDDLDAVFFSIKTITVGEENVSTPVALERISCKLKLEVSDLPAEVSDVEVTVQGFSQNFYIGSLTNRGTSNETFTFNGDGLDNMVISAIPNGSEGSSYTVQIVCKNSNGDILADKTIDDVLVYQNKITTLKGELFGESNSKSDVVITVLDEWEEPLTITF